jgi:phosphoribosylformylglycinamidine (FGAM) synthase-like enzyme
VYRQYDHQVQTNTVVPPGSDAAVLRIKGTTKGIALTTDGNGRQCYLDPHAGGAMAVAEACRNLVCTGASPIALTDCLNFGDPERPEVYFQLERCISGMVEACQALGIPIVSGNVSLYNETKGNAIYPTPVVGALGLIEDITKHCTQSFEGDGDLVVLLGTSRLLGLPETLAGSEYLEIIHGLVAGRPSINLESEAKVQQLCQLLISGEVISASHDCSEGGLAVALAEGCIAGGQGFKSHFTVEGRWDSFLFGETTSQIIVTLPQKHFSNLARLAKSQDVPWMELGVLGGTQFYIKDYIDMPLVDMTNVWRSGLDKALHT